MNRKLNLIADSETDPSSVSTFEEDSQRKPPGPLTEFVDFLTHNKRWWLTPIIIILLLMSLLILLTDTVIWPGIYFLL